MDRRQTKVFLQLNPHFGEMLFQEAMLKIKYSQHLLWLTVLGCELVE